MFSFLPLKFSSYSLAILLHYSYIFARCDVTSYQVLWPHTECESVKPNIEMTTSKKLLDVLTNKILQWAGLPSRTPQNAIAPPTFSAAFVPEICFPQDFLNKPYMHKPNQPAMSDSQHWYKAKKYLKTTKITKVLVSFLNDFNGEKNYNHKKHY